MEEIVETPIDPAEIFSVCDIPDDLERLKRQLYCLSSFSGDSLTDLELNDRFKYTYLIFLMFQTNYV